MASDTDTAKPDRRRRSRQRRWLPGTRLGQLIIALNVLGLAVLIVGALVLFGGMILLHYWKRIILLFAPLMGKFGKSLQERWRKPKTDTPPS